MNEENSVKLLGGLEGFELGKVWSMGYRVYDSNGLCPTILANIGGLGILTVVEKSNEND